MATSDKKTKIAKTAKNTKGAEKKYAAQKSFISGVMDDIVVVENKKQGPNAAEIINSISNWSEIDSFIDKLIDFSNIEIIAVDFHKKQDLMIVVLSNGKIIREAISKFPLLSKGNEKQLKQYQLYAGKTAIEWEVLDEDISLRGLLKDQILHTIAA